MEKIQAQSHMIVSKWRCGTSIVILLAVMVLKAASANAAGLTIAPSQLDVELTEAQTLTRTISITNNTSYAQEVLVKAIDFGGLDESGGLIFLGSNGVNAKYGLAKWMSVNRQAVAINAGETQSVVVTIRDQSDLSPGAHYGGILFTKEGVPSTPGAQVPLRQSIASLLFMNKLGAVQRGMTLDKAIYNDNILSNKKLSLIFNNAGNIFQTPRGLVQILDNRGREVMRGAINESSLKTFPGTSRTFKVSLYQTIKALWPGNYRMNVQYRYDGEQDFKVATYVIYNYDWRWIVISAVFFLLAFGISAYFAYRFVFRKKRKKA